MLTPAELIQKKRDKTELTSEEIKRFIEGISNGEVADYKATAFLMAVYFNGMTLNETVALTQAMLDSGLRYDLSDIEGPKVDKHSTGGVGDKVSLILAPLAAACDLKVPMMSGRGLGHSGGTLDKLESISGFKIQFSETQFKKLLTQVGTVMIGQSEQMVPADRKLYALRDVTATVECIPLITASILSKKLAEGTDHLILDLKVGNGAFMKTKKDAQNLAQMILKVSKKMGLKSRVVISDMNQPLGYAVGNSLEVLESIEVLQGKKFKFAQKNSDLSSNDLKELTVQLVAHMLELCGKVKKLEEGRKLALQKLQNGEAWRVFVEMVTAQNGDLKQIENPESLPIADQTLVLKAKKRGYVTSFQTDELGRVLVELGGGRKKASDQVDPSVGLLFHKKTGGRVAINDKLVTVFYSKNTNLIEIEERIYKAIEISSTKKTVPKLVHQVIK